MMLEDQEKVLVVLQNTNLKKKYINLAESIHLVEANWVIQQQTVNLIYDVFNGCFDDNLSSCSSKLLHKILSKLYVEVKLEGDIAIAEKWTSLWIQSYCDALKVNQNYFHLNTSSAINQTIADVRLAAIPAILKSLQHRDGEFGQRHLVWGFCSLMRIAKVTGHLIIDSQRDQLTSKIGLTIELKMSTLKNWLFNQDRAIQQEVLQAIVDNNKLTEPTTQFELESTLQFIQSGLRTSHPNYRKEYLVRLKWFFERIRKCHEKDFQLLDAGKPPKKNLEMVTCYLNKMVVALFEQLYPDVAFEVANPVLEITKMIYSYFGAWQDIEIRKGVWLKKVGFLRRLECQPFSDVFFEALLTQLSSCWQSARILSFEVIQLFPPTLNRERYFRLHTFKNRVQLLMNAGLLLIGDPVIRRFESGAYLLSWLLSTHAQQLHPSCETAQLAFMQVLLDNLRERYLVFRAVFSTDLEALQKNLIHGYICTLWIILERNHVELLPSVELSQFMTQVIDLLRDIMDFATQLSADQSGTQIFSDATTQGTTTQKNLEVDCRGHFYFKEQVIKNVGVLLQGNALIVEGDGEGGDNLPENILVVSFYLVTRECGQFFFHLAALLDRHEKLQKQLKQPASYLVADASLQAIVYQFFHALLNIKHLGSIDRIAQGLNQVAKVMGQSKTPQLPNLVVDLLEKLIDAFNQNSMLNIFRRSQGLPHVVACLLKSLPTLDRSKHIRGVVQVMLDFARQQDKLELKVHSLNILKKLFMEAQLRDEMEPYTAEGFMLSIGAFAYDDWSVRNSALMLFSALSSRTIGRQTNSDKLGARKNLIEFFAMAPQLVPFFNHQIDDFVAAHATQIYPSLYPITLLLSRLIPHDMRMHRTVVLEDQSKWTFQPDQIERMLPALIECCATNKNYLGRVMVSKSVLPFLKFEDIPQWAANILDRVPDYEYAVRHHNLVHGLLLITKQVMVDYYAIKVETHNLYDATHLQAMHQSELNLLRRLQESSYLVTRIQCPPIQLAVYEILIIIMRGITSKTIEDQLLSEYEEYARELIREAFQAPTFRVRVDMSHSILRKKCLSFLLKRHGIYSQQPSLVYHLQLINSLTNKYLLDSKVILVDDLEVYMFLLKQLNLVVKKSTPLAQDIPMQATVDQILLLLGREEAGYSHFSLCVHEALRLLLNLNNLTAQQLRSTQIILRPLSQYFHLNASILKQIIKVSGMIVQQLPDVELEFFSQVCHKYSQSDNIDDQRIAVIKSFKICFSTLMLRLQKQKVHLDEESITIQDDPEAQKIILSFYSVFLTLLQDEIPEVRQKISKFLCGEKSCTLRLNFEYVLTNFYATILPLQGFRYGIVLEFLLGQIYRGQFYATKRINHFQKKIFAIEKGNKFHNDFKIAEMSYRLILQLTTSQTQRQELSKQLSELSNEFLTLTMEQAQTYESHFYLRDEYIFENLYQLMIHGGLQRCSDPLQYTHSAIFLYVMQPSTNFDYNLKSLGQ